MSAPFERKAGLKRKIVEWKFSPDGKCIIAQADDSSLWLARSGGPWEPFAPLPDRVEGEYPEPIEAHQSVETGEYVKGMPLSQKVIEEVVSIALASPDMLRDITSRAALQAGLLSDDPIADLKRLRDTDFSYKLLMPQIAHLAEHYATRKECDDVQAARFREIAKMAVVQEPFTFSETDDQSHIVGGSSPAAMSLEAIAEAKAAWASLDQQMRQAPLMRVTSVSEDGQGGFTIRGVPGAGLDQVFKFTDTTREHVVRLGDVDPCAEPREEPADIKINAQSLHEFRGKIERQAGDAIKKVISDHQRPGGLLYSGADPGITYATSTDGAGKDTE